MTGLCHHFCVSNDNVGLHREEFLSHYSDGFNPISTAEMNVVALVSGGKDSCYSILKCRQHGHSVIALAHILPPLSIPEPDSHMYQSVASSAVSTLAKALSLPLHTVRTSSRAITKTLYYTPTPSDEVEDLVELLRTVRKAHPTVRAVCAGALWSDYQRLRVENAASRVGLLSLAYLWRRKQSDLLDEMIAAGVQAVLVKVAGIGLGPQHLGKTLAEMRPTLQKLAKRYGSHVCGEGGEFETYVTWMPGFRQNVVLSKIETVLHSEDPVAPVAYLNVLECRLEPLSKEQEEWPSMPPFEIPIPFRETEGEAGTHVESPISVQNEEVAVANDFEETSVGTSPDFLYVTVRSPKTGRDGVIGAAKRLEAILQSNEESLGSIVYVQLFLHSVSGEKYADANRGYSQVFGVPECTPPPSRACVGISANNNPVTLEALVRRNRHRKQSDSFTLHVQSLSEWAPPCIGPYAQFVEEDGILHISGVLPLYAPLANIPGHLSAKRQVEACAYNIRRTLEASRACVEQLGIFVVYVVAPSLVDDIREQMRSSLEHECCLTVVVPVSQLPKGGLVEIRAIGTIDEADLYKPDEAPRNVKRLQSVGLRCETVVCGKLGFAVVTFNASAHSETDQNFTDLIQLATSTTEFESSASPLSVQVFVLEHECTALETKLTESFPECAVSVFRSAWMPREATFVCIATFAL